MSGGENEAPWRDQKIHTRDHPPGSSRNASVLAASVPIRSLRRPAVTFSLSSSRSTLWTLPSSKSLLALDEDLPTVGLAPETVRAAQNLGIVRREDMEQIPQIHRVQLHRGCRGQQHRPSPPRQLLGKAVEQLFLRQVIDRGLGEVGASDLVRLIPDHAGEALVKQLLDQERLPSAGPESIGSWLASP